MKLADKKENAKYILYVRYGIGEPRTEYQMTATMGLFAPEVSTTKTSTYRRWMFLDATEFDPAKNIKNSKPVWNVAIQSFGSSSDLRVVVPALIYASSDYLNVDSKREVSTEAHATDLNEFVYKVKANEFMSRNIASDKN